MFGLTGGLIPCPAAITVLLLCLQLKEFTLGFVLVLCFSIGLAITLVTVGVAAALSVRHATNRWSWFSTFAPPSSLFLQHSHHRCRVLCGLSRLVGTIGRGRERGPGGDHNRRSAGLATSLMLHVLANRTYRRLFGAQLLALVGTGLTTVALGLLAYDLAGDNAGTVLGTALALKMVAYVGVAPVAGGFAARLPRRALLVVLDLCRAGSCCRCRSSPRSGRSTC